MLQWMGGSRRKLRASAKSLKTRQQQFFEHRRQEQTERIVANRQLSATNIAQRLQQNRSLDILGLENLCSSVPCVHEPQSVAGADQGDEDGQPDTSLKRNEKQVDPPQTVAFGASESEHIQQDNSKLESVHLSNRIKTDIKNSHGLDSGTHKTSDKSATSVKTAAKGLGYQPDFKILDIIKDSKAEVSTKKSASESYATFTLTGDGGEDQLTLEPLTSTETPLHLSNAQELFGRKFPTSSLSPSLDNGLLSHKDNAKLNGCCLCRSEQGKTKIEESEPNLWNQSSPMLDDNMSYLPLLCIGAEGNSTLPWNPFLSPESDSWVLPELESLTDTPFLEKHKTPTPINQEYFPESTLFTKESLKESTFHHNQIQEWSSPALRPPGCKQLNREFLVSSFRNEETQLDYETINHRNFTERTPTHISLCQIEIDDPSYISLPASSMQDLDLEESKLTTSFIRSNCDKRRDLHGSHGVSQIMYEAEDISGEWCEPQNCSVDAMEDISGEWCESQRCSMDDALNLDDWIKKTRTTISPNISDLHNMANGQLDRFKAKFMRSQSETLSTKQTEVTTIFELDLKLQSIGEENFHPDLEPSTYTSDIAADVIDYSQILPSTIFSSGSSPERKITLKTSPSSSWHSYSGSGSTQIPCSSRRDPIQESETMTSEPAGESPYGGKEFEVSMFIQKLEAETGLEEAETLIVYFPTANEGREKSPTPGSFVSRSTKEETSSMDFTVEEADGVIRHIASPLHTEHHWTSAVNGQDASPLRHSRGEDARHENGNESLSGETWTETDNFGRFHRATRGDDGKVKVDEPLADKMETVALSQKLQEFELELMQSTSEALEAKLEFGKTTQDSIPTSKNQYHQSKSSDRFKSCTSGYDLLYPEYDLYKRLEGHIQLRQDQSDKQTYRGSTEKTQETSYGNKKRDNGNSRETPSVLGTTYKECSSQFRRERETQDTKSEEGREMKKSRCDHDKDEKGLNVESYLGDRKQETRHDQFQTEKTVRLQESSLFILRNQDSPQPTCFSQEQQFQTSKIQERVGGNEAPHKKATSGCTQSPEGHSRKSFRTYSHLKNEKCGILVSQQRAPYNFDKEGECEIGSDIFYHHQETNRNSPSSGTPREKHQSFTWSQGKSQHQAISLRSSNDNSGNRTQYLCQRQASWGSITGRNGKSVFRPSLNVMECEDQVVQLTQLLESESSNKDEAYDETRCISDCDHRRSNQKSSSSNTIREEHQPLIPRKEMLQSRSTSLSSSNKYNGSKTACLSQRDLHASNARETADKNSHQLSNDSDTEENCNGKSSQYHPSPEEHRESPAINTPTEEHRDLSQQNTKEHSAELPSSLSDDKYGNETSCNSQRQGKNGSNSAGREEKSKAGFNPHEQRSQLRTPTTDINNEDNRGGAQFKAKGHTRDPHQKDKDEKSAAVWCLQNIPSSNEGATNDGIFEDFNLQHQVNRLGPSSFNKKRESMVDDERTVHSNDDLNISSTKDSMATSLKNKIEEFTYECSKLDGTKEQLLVSERSSTPSASTHLNTNDSCVQKNATENVGGTSQTSEVQRQSCALKVIPQSALIQPIQFSRSILGDRSSAEFHDSEAGGHNSQGTKAETPSVQHKEGNIRESPKTDIVELCVDAETPNVQHKERNILELNSPKMDLIELCRVDADRTLDPAKPTSPRSSANNGRSPLLPTDSLSHHHHTALATQGPPTAENPEVSIPRYHPGDKFENEASKLAQIQQMGDPASGTNGGQEAATQYVTMLESFIMQLKFENRILQETLVEQTRASRGSQE